MKTKFIVINDLHFGIPDTKRVYEELNQIFIPYLKSHKVDVIFFAGDFYDHKLLLGEPASLMAVDFFSKVVDIAENNDIKIRIIEGTESHDMFQPRILENCIGPFIDYKYYETVGDEDINGMKVLYIPEEYPLNINEYYQQYKENKYDLMITHATWDFINFGQTIDNDRNDIHTAPVFKYQEWKDALEHGLAISGHIHGRHTFKTEKCVKVVYPGSFSAWSYDQISPRGFLVGEFDHDTHKTTYELVDNNLCPTYTKFSLSSYNIDFNEATVEELIDIINKEKGNKDNIKVDINDIPPLKQKLLKDYFKENRFIDIDMDSQKISKTTETIEEYKKYDYLLNSLLSIDRSILKFILEDIDSNCKISLDRINEILKPQEEE